MLGTQICSSIQVSNGSLGIFTCRLDKCARKLCTHTHRGKMGSAGNISCIFDNALFQLGRGRGATPESASLFWSLGRNKFACAEVVTVLETVAEIRSLALSS